MTAVGADAEPFFEPLPEPEPVEDRPPFYPQLPWQPPINVVPVIVPLSVELARTHDTVVCLHGMDVYPQGLTRPLPRRRASSGSCRPCPRARSSGGSDTHP